MSEPSKMLEQSSAKADRRARAGRLAGWSLSLSLAGAAAAGPALAEAKVHRQLRDRLGVEDGFAIDLDLGGLELRGMSRALPDKRGRVRADSIHIRPSFDGLVIEVDGLEGVILRRAPKPSVPKARATGPKSEPTPVKAKAGQAAPRDPIAALLTKLRGIPIEIVTRGQITVELADGLQAKAIDLQFGLPGDGQIFGHGRFELGAKATAVSGAEPSWAQAELEFAAVDERPRELRLRGTLELGSGGGDRLTIVGEASPARASLELQESAGGRASIGLERNFEPGRDRVTLDADALPLDLLEPLAQLFGRRLADALGEREGRVDLDDARISGKVELIRGAGLTRARLDAVELSKVTITSDLLAPKPILLTDLQLDGELAREHTETGPRSSGSLVLGHAGVAFHVSAQLDEAAFDLNLELPTTPCQTLLGALPGAPSVLAGTEMRGDLDAHFGLHLDFAALAESRELYLGEDAEPLELEDFDAPGELRFELPYLERCELVRLGPGVDLDGLSGAYRHDFETDAGVDKRRVLAPGDENYVALDDVPKLALAFVILEDARFWDHDGFDREQIERAFWYNLLEGRVSRGASTISQQTTRSLWLGIDRSVARKLSEAMLAAELERKVDKQRILEIYLNIIELGPEVHGVTEAAQYHFGKQPGDLSLIQALHLASMAPAPVAYSRRFADGTLDDEWREHLRAQVRRLRLRHLISAKQVTEANKLRLHLRRHPELL